MAEKRRIGIMGGTFDPIHTGHLILGEKAYEQFSLDSVWFMPCGNPPHKQQRQGRATDEQRVEMVRLAIEDNPHFELSLMEMHENGYTYTYHTLETLRSRNPEDSYYFIIGADSLQNFHQWMEPGRIAAACTLVVATRNQTPTEELLSRMEEVRKDFDARIELLDTMNMDISSQMIRSWVQEDKSIRYYVRDSVRAYISDNNIYRD